MTEGTSDKLEDWMLKPSRQSRDNLDGADDYISCRDHIIWASRWGF